MFLATVLSAALLSPGTPTARAHATAPATRTFARLRYLGATSPRRVARVRLDATQPSPGTDAIVRQVKRGNRAADVRPHARASAPTAIDTNAIPAPAGFDIAKPDHTFSGFGGLTHYDQRTAGTGAYANTQFSLEPPDQALCVGNGFVVEAVNNALAVYTTSGATASGPIALSQFFGLDPEIVRPNGPYGPFISDPRCRFDVQTQRWFVTELEIDTNAQSGKFGRKSATLIAVSRSADPTGTYDVVSFDTTDPSHPNCPCFGDQPLIGADANGFYVSTNEFPITGNGFNGAQIYALSKTQLARGILPTVVHFDTGALATPDVGGIWYSVQPASAPPGDTAGIANTEFFLSALDFNDNGTVGQTFDDRVAVWAMTDTASLANDAPNVALQNVTIAGATYTQPPNAVQAPGPTPLGTQLGAPLELLQTNDDRMNAVAYGGGHLFSAVNTAVRNAGAIAAGIAYFDVVPKIDARGHLAASMAASGYVVANGANLLYPSIGVNTGGTAVLACSLAGSANFPSVAYYRFGENVVRIAGAGTAPQDGFTGYAAYGGNGASRWGDYSAAATDADGSIWFAAENAVSSPRTSLANWSTFVGRVR